MIWSAQGTFRKLEEWLSASELLVDALHAEMQGQFAIPQDLVLDARA
jgi:hypothetical protein